MPYEYYFPNSELEDTPGLFPMPKCYGFTLEEASIDDLQRAMARGFLNSVQLVQCCLSRDIQTDEYINSVLERNPDVFQIAASLDLERRMGKVRSPLHGIPFLVKENIATKDKMQTTAGSHALLGSIVPRDAHVVRLLREAGAVLLGKATLSEWADMRSNNYSEGYSARGGQARSPYNLTLNPGGSSSGSAAAVAANVVPFSLGTETDGSVISPAERNAVVGIKPTVGLTSRAGVIPESIHQDTVGTFGKTVRDATYAFDAIFGPDSMDNYTAAQVGNTPKRGYASFLADKSALKGAKFGLPWNSFWLPNYETIVSPNGWDWDYGTTRGRSNESEYTVVKVDFYNNIKSYLSELKNTNIRSLEDIVAYNYANDGTEGGNPWPFGNPAFYSGQDGFLASLETKGRMDETYYQALEFCQRSTREDGIDAALAQGPDGSQLDALLVPPDVGQTYQIAAQAGYPMITVPASVQSSTGMPFGLALMQTAWGESKLIRYASAIENLQRTSGTPYKRTLPGWYGYLRKNIPVLNL
ncbi:amidase signature enzyme [Eremomyces bilateralis CBS 781.70]|uniref:Amidase signature enzyme n=1 Tax=Eremomyces bilateralis CBS 781.70 TaxID=1392243 RepID=A0A6G1FUN0_9PEZI|nr:amidase signature enzyme [Eremomyces bilateralis CBS 781.70]KAF1809484.1 amidase signature enzyme [Eremomyces bilateralis CBS 781.70]